MKRTLFWIGVLCAATLALAILSPGAGGASATAVAPRTSPPYGSSVSVRDGLHDVHAADSMMLLPVADSSICSGAPGNLGNSPTLAVEGFVSNSCRALLRFDLSSLPPNAVIDSATLALWLNSGGCIFDPCTGGVPTSALLVTSSWQETTVTWGNQPSVLPGGVSRNISSVGAYSGWDITGYARAWHTGTSANHGVELRGGSVDLGYWLDFSSREGAHSPFLGIVYHTVPICDAVTQIPKAECQALVDLYNSTGGSGWTYKMDWLVTNTPCSWHGVTCASGHVTYLHLSSNNLTGSIPASLGNLTNLRILSLHNNNLTGGIPSELGNLSNLQRLWLNYNQLSGAIPSSLGNLSSLLRMDLNDNQLSGAIPSSLGNLSSLQLLLLSKNQLIGGIPSSLGNLSSLVQMGLNDNQLNGSIPSSLGNLANLQLLYLGNNQLSGGIPTSLGSLSNLEFLFLEDNDLTGNIPSNLGSLSKLIYLQLNGNQLTGGIPPTFGSLAALESLRVHDNPLSGALPQSLKSLALLSHFYFHNTSLCEPPDAAFQAWLAGIPDLQRTNVKCSAATPTPTRTPTRGPGTKKYLPIIMKQRVAPGHTPTPTRTPTRTPTPGEIFSDNFNNGLLTGWAANKGMWTNPGTYMRGQDTDPPGYEIRNVKSATGANFVYEGTVNLVSGYSVGLNFRTSADGTLGYEVGLSTVDNQFKLGVLAPNYGHLTDAPVVVQYGRAYRIKIVANGSLIEVYLDGVKKLSATNSQYSSGRFGVIVRGGLGTYQGIANFDNLVARALP